MGALYGLGCAAYEQEQSAEAKDYLERALALAPSNALCHRVLGCVFDQIEDTSRALVHYERAVALDPSIAGDAVIRERVTADIFRRAGIPVAPLPAAAAARLAPAAAPRGVTVGAFVSSYIVRGSRHTRNRSDLAGANRGP